MCWTRRGNAKEEGRQRERQGGAGWAECRGGAGRRRGARRGPYHDAGECGRVGREESNNNPVKKTNLMTRISFSTASDQERLHSHSRVTESRATLSDPPHHV